MPEFGGEDDLREQQIARILQEQEHLVTQTRAKLDAVVLDLREVDTKLMMLMGELRGLGMWTASEEALKENLWHRFEAFMQHGNPRKLLPRRTPKGRRD